MPPGQAAAALFATTSFVHLAILLSLIQGGGSGEAPSKE
jgi:hypothetical protein